MSHVYCQECGFQNPEASNYCARCGALLAKEEGGTETTQTYSPDDMAEAADAPIHDTGVSGPALVVRQGGGRAGETFHTSGKKTMIGRSPDCEVFLDDVTVSRRHAALVEEDDGQFYLEDQGSLNGTFVNRKRIERVKIDDGDELQVGKYRLTFLKR